MTTRTDPDGGPGHGSPDLVELPAAPPLPEAEGAVATAATAAVPLLGAVGSVVVVLSMGHGSAQGWLLAGGVLLASLCFAGTTVWRTHAVRRQRLRRARRRHAARLDEARTQVLEAARRQRAAATTRHPSPGDLVGLLTADAVPRRGLEDPDRLVVRYGVATGPLGLTLRVGDPSDDEDTDPVAEQALERFLTTHRELGGLPALLPLGPWPLVVVRGSLEPARGLLRALLCSAAATHDPEDLAVVLLSPGVRQPSWSWLTWLPHAWLDPSTASAAHGTDPTHLVASREEDLPTVLGAALEARSHGGRSPHFVVVVDDPGHAEAAVDAARRRAPGRATVLLLEPTHPGLTADLAATAGLGGTPDLGDTPVLCLQDDPPPSRRRPRPAEDPGRRVTFRAPGAHPVLALADSLTVQEADAVARRLTGRAIGRTEPAVDDPLAALLHLGHRAGHEAVGSIDPRVGPGPEELTVELGRDDLGRPVVLDLKEAAQGGSGPHGLLIGATGSGKSELLRTLVLGLATGHDPQTLNLLLVDFKGGATFAVLADLPHVSAVITNLAADLALVDRMRDALDGELHRRQELLRAAGGFSSRVEYDAARRGGRGDLPPLPTLLVVIDEFSELLTARPELVDLLVAVGRLGRSLGIHLLLASQRLEEGRLRGLDSHLSYRVALRTFSAAESRTVIGVADAHELPSHPGAGYLRVGPDAPVRFTTTYVSGPAAGSVVAPARPGDAGPVDRPRVRPFVLRPVAPHPTDAAPRTADDAGVTGPTVLDVVVDRLRPLTPRARPVWLPPLSGSPALADLLPDLERRPGLGLVSAAWRARGRLSVPLGVVDLPREQRYDVLTADLSGAAGHVAVVGGPLSGRSTTLQTLVAGLALTRTPREVQVYVLDAAGGSLAPLAGLPHVGAVADRSRPDLVRRVVAHVRGLADDREAAAGARGPAASFDAARSDVVLVVDQWSALRADFPDLEPVLVDLAQRGLSHGIHLALSATRWADLRPSLRDVLGTRVELRLGDPLDSEVDRRLAAQVPPGRPGRGLAAGGRHALVARPAPATRGAVDAERSEDAERVAADGHRDLLALVDAVRGAWEGPGAPAVRLLPRTVPLEELRAERPGDPRLLLGLEARTLGAAALDLEDDPHLLVLGDGRSGRTTALRTVLHELRRVRSSDDTQVFLVDPRRTLAGELDDAWCADQAGTADEARRLVADLVDALRARLPGRSVSPEQRRLRSWWSGKEAVLVVDDAELMTGPAGNPLEALLPLLPHAHDVGLRLVLSRRSTGLSRRPDPVVTALRELDQPVLLLGEDPTDAGLPTGLAGLSAGLTPGPSAGSRPGHGRLVRRSGVLEVQVAATTT